jgi:hypothetical protein
MSKEKPLGTIIHHVLYVERGAAALEGATGHDLGHVERAR